MRIPNYDVEDDVASNFRQLYDFMPHQWGVWKTRIANTE